MIKDFRNNNKKIDEFITSCSRQRRFLIPAMLLLLAEKSTHGYDLIEKYSSLGFTDANSDAGAVYRTLKNLEAKGFIKSEWETDKPGAAKKIYSITEPGLILLKRLVGGIRERKKTLELFINRFESLDQI
ncbi:MAG: helix-turn-helix transcriptional regulator [Actinobacteria bacterium]|nr:helix-turn-helix transcriptional regulator [Actinomycetota bacterium]